MTSRDENTALNIIDDNMKLTNVDVMTQDESLKLLRGKIGSNKMDEDRGKELIELLEYILLAISQAAAHLSFQTTI